MKKIILWMCGGMLLTVGAFFIPGQTGSMWPSLISSSIVAFLYLIAFSVVWLKKIESKTKQRTIAVVVTVLIVFSAASATISYKGSVNQLEFMSEIRMTIDKGIAEANIKDPMLETLREFHSSQKNIKEIGRLFSTKYDSLITEDSVFTHGSPMNDDDQSVFLYLDEAASNRVVLIGESSHVDGKNSEFSNYSGNTGRFQVRGILTAKGVDYERQN